MFCPHPLRAILLGAGLSSSLLAQGTTPQQDLREAARLDSLKQCDAAEAIYKRLLAHPRPSTALLNNAGNHYISCGSPENARAMFERVLAGNPTHLNANLQMARFELAAGRRARAVEYLAMVEKAQGVDADSLAAIAQTYERLRVFDRAESVYSRLLTQQPDNADLLLALGRNAARAQHLERAQRALEAALRVRPGHVDTLLELGRVHVARQDPARGVYLLANAKQLAPKRADVLLALAQASEQAGYYGDSAVAYDEYLALNPADEGAQRDRALVYGLTQRQVEGRQALQAYLRKHPSDAVGWLNLARITWSSDGPKALEYLNEAVRLDGRSAPVRFARAWLLYRLGKIAEALPDLQAAVAAEPENVQALAQLGLTYLSLDKPAEAEKPLRRALALAPEDPDVLLHLGRSLIALDRPEEGQGYLAKFQKVRPQVVRGPRAEPGMIQLATSGTERTGLEIERLRSEARAHSGDLQLQLNLASLLYTSGDSKAGLAEFQDLMKRGPDGVLAHEAGAFLLKVGQYDLACQFLELAAGGRVQARLDLAKATLRTDGPKAALKVLEPAPEADSFLLRAKILDEAGDSEGAEKALAAGLSSAHAVPADSVCEAASLLAKYGREEQAIELLDKTEGDPDLDALRATLLALKGRLAEAESAIRNAERRSPESSRPYLTHSFLLARSGNHAEARKKAMSAIALGANRELAACVLDGSDCDLRKLIWQEGVPWCTIGLCGSCSTAIPGVRSR